MNKSDPIRYPLLEKILKFSGLTLQATYTNRDVAKLSGSPSAQSRIALKPVSWYRETSLVAPNFCL